MRGAKCDICGTSKGQVKKHGRTGLFLCSKHRHRIERYGSYEGRTRFDPNKIIIYEAYAEVVMYDKKCQENGRAKIDITDIPLVQKHKWHINKEGYAATNIGQGHTARMHRYLLSPPDDLQIDHINLDKLDNRRANLRLCNNQQNGFNHKEGKANTSGRIGVTYDKEKKKWMAQISLNRKNIFLGYFNNFQDAVKARERAEMQYFGSFAFERSDDIGVNCSG